MIGVCHVVTAIPDSRDDNALAVTIGTKVRAERVANGMTLDALADATGVSRRLLVSIEKGEANPSVGTLLKVSTALGVGLPALVELPVTNELHVVRAGQGAVLWTGDFGGTGVLLVGSSTPDALELWEWNLQPGECHISEKHSTGTREVLQVHRGVVSVSVESATVAVKRGEALGFAGDRPHEYSNRGSTAARFTLVVFEPGAREVKRRLPRIT